jgi:hypothetical protein
MPVTLAPRDRLSLTLEKQGGVLTHVEHRSRLPYTSCDDGIASVERVTKNEQQGPAANTTD